MMVTVWYVKKKLNCKHFYFVNTKMYNKTLAGGENNDNKS